ncbi:MAG: VWA domain-containing protein [Deltaproteobacteria bacterium]|nr:VWA domain-containing protein [Deltaproteobacteria bacterium]
MNLSHPWVVHFLWVVPITALLFIICNRQKMRAMERFADPELLGRLTGDIRKGRRMMRSCFLLAALGLMILALAGPRWGSHYQEVSQKGVDIMIVLDVSSSMLVEDVKPNRLERAKREISDFIRVVEGDRVGLVAFSGAAFTQCPLTLDYGALAMFLNALGPDMVPVSGTDLGAALETAMSSFDSASDTDKVILLMTDGEDNEKKGLQAAREAAKKGIKIFVFGIGEPTGGPIPSSGGKGGFKKDTEGQLIMSKLNEEGLSEIAAATGGSYIRSVAGDFDLDILYFEGIKTRTEAATLKSGKVKVYEERFTLFVIAAFFFLLLEGMIGDVGSGRRGV